MSLTTAGHAEDIRGFSNLCCASIFLVSLVIISAALATSKHRQIRTF